jgi:hypothetical protein
VSPGIPPVANGSPEQVRKRFSDRDRASLRVIRTGPAALGRRVWLGSTPTGRLRGFGGAIHGGRTSLGAVSSAELTDAVQTWSEAGPFVQEAR